MREKGFTLLEGLFVTFITAALIAILATALIQSRIIFQATDISATLQANSRRAAENMALDLSQANRTPVRFTILQDDPAGTGSDSIAFELPQYDAGGKPVLSGGNISWDPEAVTIILDPLNSSLVRTKGGSSRILANNVRRVNFY
ncbi:MAG: hypothetical protein WC321_06960, partial [Candidatus Omnitrophota bacterium]